MPAWPLLRHPLPARVAWSHVHMHKGTVRLGGGILADPADEALRLRSSGRRVDQAIQHFGITDVATPIAVQVVHPAISILINEDVRGRTQLVLAEADVAE